MGAAGAAGAADVAVSTGASAGLTSSATATRVANMSAMVAPKTLTNAIVAETLLLPKIRAPDLQRTIAHDDYETRSKSLCTKGFLQENAWYGGLTCTSSSSNETS